MSLPAPKLDITTFLVASIHDMKNSVSVMNAVLEDVVRGATPAGFPEIKQIGEVLYEARRVNDNLIQLLALYKIDQQFYPFDAQEHELDDFVEEIMGRVAPLAANRQLVVRHNCPPGLRWYFDRELIFGAITQALHNGLRYTHSQVLLNIREKAGLLEFRVEDDGPGYPQNMLEEEEAQPIQGIRFATGSTGLGLYFSAVAARLHRDRGLTGSTRLENGGSLGGGAFILTLP